MNNPTRIALFALALGCQSLAFAQALVNPPPAPKTETELKLEKYENVPQLLAIGAEYEKRNDWFHFALVMKRIQELRPYAGNIGYELAAAASMQGDMAGCYNELLKLKDNGYAFSPDEDERFKKCQSTEPGKGQATGAWNYIVASFKEARKPFGGGSVAFELPAGDLLLESLTYDSKRRQFLVGSMRDGKVSLVEGDKLTTLVTPNEANGVLAVSDLVADAAHDALWVASTSAPTLKGIKKEDLGHSRLSKFKLSDGSFVAKYEVPQNGGVSMLGSLAVAPNGDIYAADGDGKRIYRIDGDKLALLVGNPRLSSIRGMAVSGDGKTLYLADYELGLFGIELGTGKPFMVPGTKTLTQFSIEGLGWYKDHLVAVQNGFPPSRVMRLTLDPEGRKIIRTQPLDASQKAFGIPTRGVIVDGKYYFIANSQKDNYDRYGVVKDEKKLERVRVYASDLAFGFKE